MAKRVLLDWSLELLEHDGVQDRGVEALRDPIAPVAEAKVKELLEENPSGLDLGLNALVDPVEDDRYARHCGGMENVGVALLSGHNHGAAVWNRKYEAVAISGQS